ncbi:MAG: tetratricopeptide repeat protein [Acidobacteria bacterium]|nr:tetratricopeptide repeat protein [Acidobacteriota bacterium]
MFSLSAKSTLGRLAILGSVAVAVFLAWFGVRWQIANMLGELTSPVQPNALEIAEAAVDLSPRDRLPRLLLAEKLKEDFTPESIAASIRNFEEAVRSSPFDYRSWIELGRSYEQAERLDEAERAFKHAVDLAPEYTFPQWQIGNFYLRRDRVDEAFAYLTKATEKSFVYREQVFALAWDYFDQDPARVEQVAADTPETRVTLAVFYSVRGAAADALRVWNSIPEDVRARHAPILKNMTQRLYEKRHFREALELARQAGIDPEASFEVISNPGFEKFFGDSASTIFGWHVNRSDSKLEILPDPNVHSEGQRGLKLNFKGYNRPDLLNVSQLVAIQPGGRYRLTFMVRVENLRTGGEPVIDVVDAKNDVLLARSIRFPLGSREWESMNVEFTVPDDCDGIYIRTSRESCGDICPINGIVWLDAFKLERI